MVSSSQERVNAAVKAIGSAAQGEVVDATKEDQVRHLMMQSTAQQLQLSVTAAMSARTGLFGACSKQTHMPTWPNHVLCVRHPCMTVLWHVYDNT